MSVSTRDPLELVMQADDERALKARVAKLPEMERLVTRLVVYEELKVGDIAGVLAVRPSRVRHWMERSVVLLHLMDASDGA